MIHPAQGKIPVSFAALQPARISARIRQGPMAMRDQKRSVYPIAKISAVQHMNNVRLESFQGYELGECTKRKGERK